MNRILSRTLTLLALTLALTLVGPIACGKRGQLEPPAGKPSTYPRPYPAN